ncbi:hypothetical protein KSF_091950 [Reticulibacter mediterranei]|uniref:Uncharacterized protein n=1 Tax=Reticulibacter mediterranei TaxID=2778369 RepID=A0A8J3IYL6_9CHLR|nr:hypothetical protein KSF_091950 [Reticulibacter mediterranei]
MIDHIIQAGKMLKIHPQIVMTMIGSFSEKHSQKHDPALLTDSLLYFREDILLSLYG